MADHSNSSSASGLSILPVLTQNRTIKLARAVSSIASPPILGTSGTLLIAELMDTTAAWIWAGVNILLVVLIPVLYIFWLLRRNQITDFDVYLREQRIKPYLATLTCGGVSCLTGYLAHAPRLFIVLSAATFLQTLVMGVINLRWKISAHAASSASFGVLIWQLFGPLSAPILLVVPLISWSRIRLHRHTLMQTVGGALLGAIMFLLMLSLPI